MLSIFMSEILTNPGNLVTIRYTEMLYIYNLVEKFGSRMEWYHLSPDYFVAHIYIKCGQPTTKLHQQQQTTIGNGRLVPI
jgi:hypothetical protein